MIYLDNAATTRMDEETVSVMLPYLSENYGNPSGIYSLAAGSRNIIDKSRESCAELIGADPSEIYFTSGGTESDNWALTCAAEKRAAAGGASGHIITTAIEHHAVLNTCRWLEKKGFEVTYLDVDSDGFVDPQRVLAAVRPDTFLISVMYANNEIGTVEPVREIGRAAREHGIIFHTDAVQAYGHLPIDVNECSIDLMSASAHKLYGPKGTGLLYARRGLGITPFVRGGAQERGLRAGTENVAGIAGFGRAASLAASEMKERAERERRLRDYFVNRVLSEVKGSALNGPALKDIKGRLSNNANIRFEGISSEELLIMLDMRGICASAGAACAAGAVEPSHVLKAIGLSDEETQSSVRFTLGKDTEKDELDFVVETLKDIVTESGK